MIAADQHAYAPQAVVEHWGPIDCIASSAYVDPAPPQAKPHPDAQLMSVVDVRIGDGLLNTGEWHVVLGHQDHANEGPDYRRFYTDLAITHGLLYRYTDDVWVLRPGGNTPPIYAEVDTPAPGPEDEQWPGFLRPVDEPQPGDKQLTRSDLDEPNLVDGPHTDPTAQPEAVR
jgi:hypothetical protein